jgi:hypothetical protein
MGTATVKESRVLAQQEESDEAPTPSTKISSTFLPFSDNDDSEE